MKYIKHFNEGYIQKYELTSNSNRLIKFEVQGGKIINLENNSGIRFPYVEGQNYNRGIETWCCNNNFTMKRNEQDVQVCPDKKIFGIRTKDVPRGDIWRTIYPDKFRK